MDTLEVSQLSIKSQNKVSGQKGQKTLSSTLLLMTV